MENSTKLQSNKCNKIASLIFGTIGLIWSALLLIICAASTRHQFYGLYFLVNYWAKKCSQQESKLILL